MRTRKVTFSSASQLLSPLGSRHPFVHDLLEDEHWQSSFHSRSVTSTRTYGNPRSANILFCRLQTWRISKFWNQLAALAGPARNCLRRIFACESSSNKICIQCRFLDIAL